MSIKTNKPKVRLMLALQGGGAKGAFTAGFIDTLLKAIAKGDPRLKDVAIVGITGTSAGALNGAVMTHALNSDDYEGARKALRAIYNEVSRYHINVSWPKTPLTPDTHRWPNIPPETISQIKASRRFTTALHSWFRPLTQFWEASAGISLSDYNGKNFYQNILRRLLNKYIPDWSAVRTGPTQLFINTYREHKKTGQGESYIFPQEDLRAANIAASASLFGPFDFEEHDHHDGAVIANPDMDMIESVKPTDLLTISLYPEPEGGASPMHQSQAKGNHPHGLKGNEIHNHLAWLYQSRKRSFHMHHVNLSHEPHWNESCALNTDPRFINSLWDQGRAAAHLWLQNDAPKLGKSDSYTPRKTNLPERRLVAVGG